MPVQIRQIKKRFHIVKSLFEKNVILCRLCKSSLYKIWSENRKNSIYVLLSMNIQVDRLAKVK